MKVEQKLVPLPVPKYAGRGSPFPSTPQYVSIAPPEVTLFRSFTFPEAIAARATVTSCRASVPTVPEGRLSAMAVRADLLSLSTVKNPAFEVTFALALSILMFPPQKAAFWDAAVVVAVDDELLLQPAIPVPRASAAKPAENCFRISNPLARSKGTTNSGAQNQATTTTSTAASHKLPQSHPDMRDNRMG